jgi:hypothetical protein
VIRAHAFRSHWTVLKMNEPLKTSKVFLAVRLLTYIGQVRVKLHYL